YVVGRKYPMPGIAGGKPGAPNRLELKVGGAREEAGNTTRLVPHEAGEAIAYHYGGGGGWGDPLERDPAKVLEDVLDEYVSPRSARDDYGVVLSGPLDGLALALDAGAAGPVARWADDVLTGKIGDDDAPAGAFDGAARLKDMDTDGIDIAVLYPTIGLSIGNAPPAIAEGLCRAYNDWLRDYCDAAPK